MFLDHLRVRHPRDALTLPDVCRDSFQGHDGAGSCFLCDLRLLLVHDIHDDPTWPVDQLNKCSISLGDLSLESSLFSVQPLLHYSKFNRFYCFCYFVFVWFRSDYCAMLLIPSSNPQSHNMLHLLGQLVFTHFKGFPVVASKRTASSDFLNYSIISCTMC